MSTAAEVTAGVRPILDEIKSTYFVAGYDASDEEAMGILLARFFEWDGIAVLTAAGYGLEDSNFHTLNGKVDRLIEAEERRINRQIKAQGKRAVW
jgi:hypothetical protein